MVRRVPSKQRNVRVARERDHGALLRFGFLLFCGLVLAGGFVYAGVQHFAALRLGYETENLRKIQKNLVEERDRLVVERQTAASPARLERAAREIGMQPMQAAQIDPLKRAARNSAEKKPTNVNPTAAAPSKIVVVPAKAAVAPAKAPVKVARQTKPL